MAKTTRYPPPLHALFAFGTRPEAIKLAPVIRELERRKGEFRVTVCLTSQHRELLRQVTSFFGIEEDADLDVMIQDQTLEHVASAVLTRMVPVLERFKPDVLLVQGDTTTVFASALAAYYRRIPVGHVEAGLRTFDKYSPFPEEMNRRLCAALTDFHFAPTRTAADNLLREGHEPTRVYVTGNTIVDAVQLGLRILESKSAEERVRLLTECGLEEGFVRRLVSDAVRLITVTAHRRESFGEPFERMCRAMADIVARYPDVEIVYPVHPNPNVRRAVRHVLAGRERVHLIEPVRYEQLLLLMERSALLLTDSGGIQEEGPSLRKPVLVMREVTERPEGIAAGVARLVGTDRERIVTEVAKLLDDPREAARMVAAENPYGDGLASQRIAEILLAGLRDA
ncbi:MAG: UDP-N-acetylglucosamine 2-epimerase (non-hydrolyzing) [Bacteroidota bacterium]|nr:UDP-N-acetylglucosamine 2-epimerase (non-hydrolyzing) [Bacteroidota bacterium]